MRHMETFKGEIDGSYKTELPKEGAAQEKALDTLAAHI